jgi:hypothetical protein
MLEHPDHIGITPEGQIVEVHDHGSTGSSIEKIYAIVSIDKDGGEGIIAARLQDSWVPMVASDLKMIEAFTPIALEMVKVADATAQIVEFSTRRVVRKIHEAKS